MLIGQTVFMPTSAGVGVVYHGPWMPRQADSFTAVFEVIKASSAGYTFKCEVQTKNDEDADTAAASLGSVIVTATQSVRVTKCKELVRYVYACTSPGADRWIHFRANPPMWEPN